MIEGTDYHVEIAGRLATVYVTGAMPAGSWLIARCRALPGTVEVLSVNLDRVSAIAEPQLMAIDELRTHWETSRSGAFRVAFTLSAGTPSRHYRIRAGA